ncbi:hypothetical protein GWI33_012712 [Rhynchophorus ferrugineus]|uniref:MADF domain-containing protein n=1 Tax=Rhynchophorus ferrugineus TaxID=354439 RepID=A0A834I5Z0_RHYFE|nr:hypothetical protein GWI33_012712 [Rhynchophorus ferrugineus]
MEWSNRTVLQLIEAYREQPVLWNSTDFYYKNRNRKEGGWNELAGIFGTDSSEIKKKIQFLLALFRREKQKVMITSGVGTNEVYNIKWFAFSSLLFLNDKNKPKQARVTEAGIRPDDGPYEPIKDDQSQHVDIDQPNNQEENSNTEINSESQQGFCEENDDSIGPGSKTGLVREDVGGGRREGGVRGKWNREAVTGGCVWYDSLSGNFPGWRLFHLVDPYEKVVIREGVKGEWKTYVRISTGKIALDSC